MNMPTQNGRSLFHRGALLAIAASVALGFYALPHAQAPAKKALTIDDYTKWRSIAGQEMSPDGRWVAYTLQLTNTAPGESKPVLHLLNLETTQEVTVPDATEPAFSSDSAWLAYQVDPWAAQRARAGRSGSGGPGPTEPAGGPATPPQPGAAAPQSNPAARSGRDAGCAPAPLRVAEPGDRRRAVVAGYRDLRLLGEVHPHVPPAPRW